jgi:hypothetical protein
MILRQGKDGKPSKVWKEIYPEHSVFAVTWGITAPWAHPIWSQYVASLCDLTTNYGQAPHIYKPGVTHEFIIQAVDPNTPIEPSKPLAKQKYQFLSPLNHGYQFAAKDNKEALDRIQKLIDMIETGMLNPDTDYISVWDHQFQDGVSLRRR